MALEHDPWLEGTASGEEMCGGCSGCGFIYGFHGDCSVRAQHLAEVLTSRGFPAECISGKSVQNFESVEVVHKCDLK